MSGCKSACRCITDNFRSNMNVGRGHCRNRRGFQFGSGGECGGKCYIYRNGSDSGCQGKCKCVKNNFRSRMRSGQGACKRVYG
uniref:Uncharacterized protein n=1 Tax=Rhipicephalus zambeziensis TaxID=60191 RepID=A0A224YBL4_9ACAR